MDGANDGARAPPEAWADAWHGILNRVSLEPVQEGSRGGAAAGADS